MVNLSPIPSQVKYTLQGGLVQAHIPQEKLTLKGGGFRGSVNAFSAAARRRLMKLLSTLAPEHALFITLTYPADYPNPRKAKDHRRAFEKRMKRLFPKFSGVWRLEFQKRGAPHFHLIVFGVGFVGKDIVKQMWGDIIGYPDVFTRVEAVGSSRRHLMAYVSKYVAKVVAANPQPGSEGGGGAAASDGFNQGAYLAADGWINPKTGELECTVGRWWGVFNAEDLPFAEAFDVVIDSLKVFHQFRRGARHLWSGVGQKKAVGFSLFVDDAGRWVDYLFAICTGAA